MGVGDGCAIYIERLTRSCPDSLAATLAAQPSMSLGMTSEQTTRKQLRATRPSATLSRREIRPRYQNKRPHSRRAAMSKLPLCEFADLLPRAALHASWNEKERA